MRATKFLHPFAVAAMYLFGLSTSFPTNEPSAQGLEVRPEPPEGSWPVDPSRTGWRCYDNRTGALYVFSYLGYQRRLLRDLERIWTIGTVDGWIGNLQQPPYRFVYLESTNPRTNLTVAFKNVSSPSAVQAAEYLQFIRDKFARFGVIELQVFVYRMQAQPDKLLVSFLLSKSDGIASFESNTENATLANTSDVSVS